MVGGLQILSGSRLYAHAAAFREALNKWETDNKDRPVKEVKLIRTEVFKNPFREVLEEVENPKPEKVACFQRQSMAKLWPGR